MALSSNPRASNQNLYGAQRARNVSIEVLLIHGVRRVLIQLLLVMSHYVQDLSPDVSLGALLEDCPMVCTLLVHHGIFHITGWYPIRGVFYNVHVSRAVLHGMPHGAHKYSTHGTDIDHLGYPMW